MSTTLPYQLAAIDIDDTLVGPDKRIGDANRKAVWRLRQAGLRVILASGRRHDNMLRYYHELALDDYIVSAQGAVTKHPMGGEVIYHAPLPGEVAAALTVAGPERGVAVALYAGREATTGAWTPWTERLKRDTNDQLERVDDLPARAARGPEKVIWVDEPARVAKLRPEAERLAAGRALVTVTDAHLLEFTAPEATKAAGVAAVAARYGIAPQHVVAFGDGENDVPLLTWAGLGVAMSHAKPAAKAAARRVAPPGDAEASLARAVDELLDGKPGATRVKAGQHWAA